MKYRLDDLMILLFSETPERFRGETAHDKLYAIYKLYRWRWQRDKLSIAGKIKIAELMGYEVVDQPTLRLKKVVSSR